MEDLRHAGADLGGCLENLHSRAYSLDVSASRGHVELGSLGPIHLVMIATSELLKMVGSFSRIIADVERIILTLDDMGARLAGPLGKGHPEIDAAHIAFNGLWDCGSRQE